LSNFKIENDDYNKMTNFILKKYDNNHKGSLNFAEFTKMNIDINGAHSINE